MLVAHTKSYKNLHSSLRVGILHIIIRSGKTSKFLKRLSITIDNDRNIPNPIFFFNWIAPLWTVALTTSRIYIRRALDSPFHGFWWLHMCLVCIHRCTRISNLLKKIASKLASYIAGNGAKSICIVYHHFCILPLFSWGILIVIKKIYNFFCLKWQIFIYLLKVKTWQHNVTIKFSFGKSWRRAAKRPL